MIVCILRITLYFQISWRAQPRWVSDLLYNSTHNLVPLYSHSKFCKIFLYFQVLNCNWTPLYFKRFPLNHICHICIYQVPFFFFSPFSCKLKEGDRFQPLRAKHFLILQKASHIFFKPPTSWHHILQRKTANQIIQKAVLCMLYTVGKTPPIFLRIAPYCSLITCMQWGLPTHHFSKSLFFKHSVRVT